MGDIVETPVNEGYGASHVGQIDPESPTNSADEAKKGFHASLPSCSSVPAASVILTAMKDQCAPRPAMLRAFDIG